MLLELLDKYRKNDGSYDVVVPEVEERIAHLRHTYLSINME